MALEKIKSMQAVTKNKKKNCKLGKVKLPKGDTNNIINPDLSNLRKPIDTSVSTLYHISKLLEDSTEEIKSILSYECDIIYECRICRSLFRSIVNLISHKREYCREKFNITLHRNVWADRNMISAIGSVIHTCQTEQTITNNNLANDRKLRSQVSKETRKRDLTTVVDKLIKKQKENIRNNFSTESELESVITDASSNQHIFLKALDTNNSAVYQTIESIDKVANVTDLIAKEVTEFQNTINQNSTTLEKHVHENQLENNNSSITADISDEEDDLLANSTPTNSLVCTTCNAKFSTKKTLTFHVKTLHTAQRVCYTCPCCTNTFANTWSVHRHMFKVHKMTHEQVRKLRSQIQEIAFDREEVTMQALKKARTTKTSASEKVKRNNALENNDKAQERTFHSESDAKDLSCSGCGKRFNTKAALSAHSQYCQVPVVTCDEVATEINWSDKTSSDSLLNNDTSCELINTDAATDTTIVKLPTAKDASDINFERTSSSPEIIDEYDKITIRVQDVSSLSKEDWDMLECHSNNPFEHDSAGNSKNKVALSTIHRNTNDSKSPTIGFYKNSQSPDVVQQDASETRSTDLEIIRVESNTLGCDDEKQPVELKERDVKVQDNYKLQPSRPIRASEIESKIATIANLRKLRCLSCNRKFTSMTNLRRHMAIHIGWYRYRCSLCDFKCFFKCDCVAHCNKMHNAQNNRAFIAGLVLEIPQDEYKDVTSEPTNLKMKKDDPDIAESTASSSQLEKGENLGDSSDTNSRVVVQNEEATRTKEEGVLESCENVKCENVLTGATEPTKLVCTNLEEYIANRAPGKLDADLKRMVMEVIFGSNNADNADKQADVEKRVSDVSNEAAEDAHTNDNKNSTVFADDTKTTYCPIIEVSKPQRPMRKRIKPISEDFIYNLNEIQFRKNICKSSSTFQLSKSSAKHHSNLGDSEILTNVRKKAKLYNKALQSD